MSWANGQYQSMIDDDDRVSENYIELLMRGAESGLDCCELNGVITEDGKNPRPFRHSLEYDKYDEEGILYRRFPNHLSCIKRELVKDFKFPPKSFSEDTDWAYMVHRAGVLKTEYKISQTIYFYDYKRIKDY